jgi:hypothetical protein
MTGPYHCPVLAEFQPLPRGTYGIPDESTLSAMRLAARIEAVITDPVYEGKSMARPHRPGQPRRDRPILERPLRTSAGSPRSVRTRHCSADRASLVSDGKGRGMAMLNRFDRGRQARRSRGRIRGKDLPARPVEAIGETQVDLTLLDGAVMYERPL